MSRSGVSAVMSLAAAPWQVRFFGSGTAASPTRCIPLSLPRDVLDELKRRRVFRVAAGYAVVAWLVIQVASDVLPALRVPEWGVTLVVACALLGFPVALVLAWAFDLGPDGVARSDPGPEQGASASSPPGGGRRKRRLAYIGTALALALLLAAAVLPRERAAARPAAAADPTPVTASIAVLPFADLSAAGDQEYFGHGLAEELLNVLAQIEGLRVAARTSSFAFAGTDASVTEIGRQLEVRAVLEGSIRTSADGIRITAQLIDASTGFHLWSQVYERQAADLFAVQDEISAAIANALELRLIGREGAAPRRVRGADLEAFRLYLRGRHAWNQRTLEGLRESIDYFERALRLDPAFALGYAGLADAYMLLEDFRGLPREEAFARGTAAARRALELDETLAEAHTSLAHILMHQLEAEASEREYRRTLALNPNQPNAHLWYSLLLAQMRRWDEALEHARRAADLDPLAVAPARGVGSILYMARRYDEAVEAWEAALERHPDNEGVLGWLAWAHLHAGRPERSIEIWTRIGYRSSLPVAYAAAGQADEARRLLTGLEQNLEENSRLYHLAIAYSHLGDLDTAFGWLDRAADQGEPMLDFLEIDPAWDLLREDPRFDAVRRKTGHLR